MTSLTPPPPPTPPPVRVVVDGFTFGPLPDFLRRNGFSIFLTIFMLSMAGLAAYEITHPRPSPPSAPPVLVSVAPDGTKLWRVYDKAQWVYFTTSSASRTTFDGDDGTGATGRHVAHTVPRSK